MPRVEQICASSPRPPAMPRPSCKARGRPPRRSAMTGTPGDEHSRRVEAAYSWAASLIALARDLISVGADVDLAPIRPAIRDLCDLLKSAGREQSWENLEHDSHELCAVRPRAVRAGADRRGGDRRPTLRARPCGAAGRPASAPVRRGGAAAGRRRLVLRRRSSSAASGLPSIIRISASRAPSLAFSDGDARVKPLQQRRRAVEEIHLHEPLGKPADHLGSSVTGRRQLLELVVERERFDRRQAVGTALEIELLEGRFAEDIATTTEAMRRASERVLGGFCYQY